MPAGEFGASAGDARLPVSKHPIGFPLNEIYVFLNTIAERIQEHRFPIFFQIPQFLFRSFGLRKGICGLSAGVFGSSAGQNTHSANHNQPFANQHYIPSSAETFKSVNPSSANQNPLSANRSPHSANQNHPSSVGMMNSLISLLTLVVLLALEYAFVFHVRRDCVTFWNGRGSR